MRGSDGTHQAGQRFETVLEFGFISWPTGKPQCCPNSQIKFRGGSRNPRAEAEGEGCPQLGTSQSCTHIPRSGGFGQNHSPEVERGEGAPQSEPKRTEPPGTSIPRFLALLLFLHFAPPPVTPLPRGLRFLAPVFAPRPPLPARGSTWRAPATGTGYKRLAAAADCGLKMRPKEPGWACAGTPPGPGHPAAVTPTPPPAADPAPEPSAEPEPAPAQPPATGQGAGSGSSSVSRPPARARRASEPGSEAGAQRASAFSGRTPQSVHRNSDAPWTRFIFQGPFRPRATGLGIGKAAGIWKTPAAYVGRGPGESDPKRAAFIRELEEGKLGSRTPEQVGLGQFQRGGEPVGSRCPALPGTLSHFSTHSRCTVCGACPVAASHLFLSFYRFLSVGRVLGPARFPPGSARLLLRQICTLSVPPSRVYRSARRGAGAAGGRFSACSEPALAPREGTGVVGGPRGKFSQPPGPRGVGRRGRAFPSLGMRRASGFFPSSFVASSPGSPEISELDLEAQVTPTVLEKSLLLSTRNRCRVGDCICFYGPMRLQ